VLATRGATADARFQFQQAIRLRPDFAEARLDYGRLLGGQNDWRGAIREFEAAVRLQQDLWRAHFELGMALGQTGDSRRAIEQLTLAANGSDPSARAEALDVLHKLGR
jgi:Flp pilus assembly protein TadD